MTHSPPSLFSPHDIATMRNLACLSQLELAESLGYDRSVISNWERGRTVMSPLVYIRFLDIIMARFVFLDYLSEQKYQIYRVTVTHLSHLSLPQSITSL